MSIYYFLKDLHFTIKKIPWFLKSVKFWVKLQGKCMQFLKLVLLVIQTNDCDCLYLKSSCHLKCLQENVLIIFNYFNLTVPQSRPFKLRQLNWLCEIFLCKYFLTSFMWIINIKGMVYAAQNMLIWTFTCLCVEFVHQFNWSWVPAKAKFVWNQQPTHNQ